MPVKGPIIGGTWHINANRYEGELNFSIGDHGKVTGTVQYAGLPIDTIEGWASPVASPVAVFFMRYDQNDDPVQMYTGFLVTRRAAATPTITGSLVGFEEASPYTSVFGWFATS